jgi:hypothetical protein
MRGLTRLLMASATAGAVLLSLLAMGLAPGGSHRADAQGGPSIGVDVDPDGNTATALGPREVCLEARKGAEFEIDLIAQDIEGLSAWEAYMAFDESVVTVVDRDVQLFLASTAEGNVFDISESVPDDEAPYRVGGANISDPPAGVSGSGVLARITLKAVGSGLTAISLAPITLDAGKVGPTFTDAGGGRIGDSNNDSFFDGPTLDGQVAVDQPCPGAGDGGNIATATLSGDGGGLAWWVFLLIAAGIVAAAGIGGVAFIALRRSGANTSA